MDEPEAALSPQRQFSLMLMLHELVQGGREVQFIVSTHSPILAFPRAQILSFDDDNIHEVEYRDTPPYLIMSRFLKDPDSFLRRLFTENGDLLPDLD